jgi:hypothetical protein
MAKLHAPWLTFSPVITFRFLISLGPDFELLNRHILSVNILSFRQQVSCFYFFLEVLRTPKHLGSLS